VFSRQSVQSALRSLISKLSTYPTVPPHGLALFCGYLGAQEDKQKKLLYTLEPLKPLESLYELLEEKRTYGFIVVDENGVSVHTLNGNDRRNLYRLEVSLPKKHGRSCFGGSKIRWARIREEKRRWYTSKVAEIAIAQFIDPLTSMPSVHGIVIAGSVKLQEEVQAKLDPRLSAIMVAVVDIQYGGEVGFSQTIHLMKDSLGNLKSTHEQKIITRLFEINLERHYALGVDDTMFALTNGLLDTLLIWNDLRSVRWELVKRADSTTKVLYLQEDKEPLEDPSDWIVKSKMAVLDWVLEFYSDFGAQIELVSDQTATGASFVKRFGGLAGLLRNQTVLPSTNDQLITQEEDEQD